MNIKESLSGLAVYTGFDNKTYTHRLSLVNDTIIITQRSNRH